MGNEKKTTPNYPWDGNEAFDKYLNTYLVNTYKGMDSGRRKYIAIPFHDEFEEKFEDDDRYINVLIPLYTAFLNDALYTDNSEEKKMKLLSLWYHVQMDVVPFKMTFPDETEDFMYKLNLAVITSVWDMFAKTNKKTNKK